MLKFSHPQIVLQEVPGEITLAFSISGCPLKCRGCHSAFTWDAEYGEVLTDEIFYSIIYKNKHISCVLLYDGLHDEDRLIELFKIVKSVGLSTAFYTGLTRISDKLREHIDYLKLGPYIKELGGLNSPDTNQRMYYKGKDISSEFKRFNS